MEEGQLGFTISLINTDVGFLAVMKDGEDDWMIERWMNIKLLGRTFWH